MALLDLADLGADQGGLVTTAQARSMGISAQQLARLSNRGVAERLAHGVYRLSGAAPTRDEGLRVAWLALDPSKRVVDRLYAPETAVVSHRSAARLYELGDLDSDYHEFTTGERKQSRDSEVKLHRGLVPEQDRTVVDGLPVTTVLRTVCDLAATRLDGGHLAGVVRDALTVRQVDADDLATALRPYAQVYGERLGDGESLLARFLQEAGVPTALQQAVRLTRSAGTAVATTPLSAVADRAQLDHLSEQLTSIKAAIEQVTDPELRESLRRLRSVTDQLSAPPMVAQLRKVNGTTQRAVREAVKILHDPAVKRLLDDWRRTP